jgi:sugar lactone lactonase YvrE
VKKIGLMILMLLIGVAIGVRISGGLPAVKGEAKPGAGFAAVPGSVGGEDLSGPYEVVKNWPKDISTLPGNEKWTQGASQSVYAENPNRIYALYRGELPKMAPPKARLLPDIGPSLSYPVDEFWRDASVASLPGTSTTDQDTREWLTAWEGKAPDIGIKGPPYRELGVDAKWENCLVVYDGSGNIVETWKQWDKIFRRPHSIQISPYDPDKNIWVVDDNMQVIYKFSHDGSQLLQTIGTPETPGEDGTHFNRPTYIDWLPDGTFFVSDGYTGTRVAKFDKYGKFLLQWGKKGGPRHANDVVPVDTRPGYFSNVHGIAVDQTTRHVFVNDRYNHRIQVFDEDGKYLYEWKVDDAPSSLNLVYIGSGNTLWVFDRTNNKMVEYDLQGHLLYAWGSTGGFPGYLWGVHGMSVDQEGNLYVAETYSGRIQKFTPRAGANPTFLVAKPVYSAWKK